MINNAPKLNSNYKTNEANSNNDVDKAGSGKINNLNSLASLLLLDQKL